jgi:ubiquinone/menaquinone biosynthesis C-methylase UbiE
MTPPPSAVADTPRAAPLAAIPKSLPIPNYLEKVYWWAYVHPNAVNVFEREWLVNLILFGNYGRLRDAAIDDLTETTGNVTGKTLQVACAYGNLTPTLRERLAADASLDVVDILPIQLKNLAAKMPTDERVTMLQGNSSALACADASYDKVLLFFLLHEQPEEVRRGTLAEALRVVKPGGKVVIVDYHRPVKLHPLRLLMTGVFRRLEPYAMDLWKHEVANFMPPHAMPKSITKQTYFGGLYQKLVLTR